MRTAVAFVALIAIGGAALGQVAPPAPAPTPAADVKQGETVTKTGADKKVRKMPRPDGATKPADATTKPRGPGDTLTSCLKLWEPATHMTRREWARACHRVDERLKAVTLR